MKRTITFLAFLFLLFQFCENQPVTPIKEEKAIEKVESEKPDETGGNEENGESGEGDQNKIKNVTISYESNYDPLPPTGAEISIWNVRSIANNEEMIHESGKYSYTFDITQEIDYVFSIKIYKPTVCKNDISEWANSPVGIRAKAITINDTKLDNSFILHKDGINFVFKVDNNGDIVPGEGTPVSINENIPPEVSFLKETVHMSSDDISGKYINAWFSVIHDTNKGGMSKVEINSMKLFARLNNGKDIQLAEDNYDIEWGGKLYIRYPYFECSLDESFQWPMPAHIENSLLVFSPSDQPNRVWHGWCTGPWQKVPLNTKMLWIEADVKITGNALMQLGIDTKNDQYSNEGWSEYGLSDWYFETSDFEKIYFNKP